MQLRALALAALQATLMVAAAMLIGVWASHALSEPAEDDERAQGETFSIPVPSGFSVVTDERFTATANGGVLLGADAPAAPDQFIGSIVVMKTGPGPDFNPSDPEFCKSAADGAGAQLPVVVKGHRTVKTAVGETCQWEVVEKEQATRGATSTVMYKTRDNCWVVICNYDTRDSRIQEACNEVLAGWEFN